MKSIENKYYTPSIEEFRVGFEYEVLEKGQKDNPRWFTLVPVNPEDEWFKFKYPDPFLGYRVDKLFKHRTIRVKYLDGSDIEELGFVISSDYGAATEFKLKDRWKLIKVKHGGVSYSKNEIRLFENDSIFGESYNTRLFIGDIKNKSELKVLLQQLNIK